MSLTQHQKSALGGAALPLSFRIDGIEKIYFPRSAAELTLKLRHREAPCPCTQETEPRFPSSQNLELRRSPMRLPLCTLALVVCACGTGFSATDAADPAKQSEQSQPPAAQAPAPAPTPPARYGGWVFSGMADGYFSDNLNHPQAS